MFNKEIFRKKILFPVTYCGVLAMALWGGNAIMHQQSASISRFSVIEPAAGEPATETAVPISPVFKVSESDLKNSPELPALESADVDAQELPPLRISPDKPEVIHLDEDAVNVLVGSEETLRAVPDTNRNIILIPKKPGATFVKITGANGHIIMQRHVIIGAPEKASKYIRIRRACANDDANCKEYSVYYCPDMCHEVNIVQGDATSKATNAPADAPSIRGSDNTDQQNYIDPATNEPANPQ
jgi:Flp pilus assembly secretin CpaC